MDCAGAAVAAALAARIATAAVERDGPAALVCTKRSSALHEAGHCVISALNGTLPTSTSIRPILHDGQIEWLGRTEGIPGGWVNEHSPVAADILMARSQLSGVIAEKLFDPDARSGSSTDEIAHAICIARGIAYKTDRWPDEVLAEIHCGIEASLRTHTKIVFAIADELMREQCVSGVRLNELLRPIWGGK
jgi:hypothetical protein